MITSLNNNLATQYGTLTPGDFDLSNPTPSYNYVKKSGKIVQLGININVNSINSVDSAKLICTLPTNFRPTRNMYLVGRAVVDGKFTSVYVYIYTSGSVSVILPAGTTTAISLNSTWIMD